MNVTFVDKKAQLQDLIENCSEQPDEAFQSVFGKEKPERVRCHGRVTTATLLKRMEEITKNEKKHADELKLLNEKVEKMKAKRVDVETLATMLLTSGTSTSTHVPNNDKTMTTIYIVLHINTNDHDFQAIAFIHSDIGTVAYEHNENGFITVAYEDSDKGF
ncbi:hypothetical protein Lal_00028325 [Lupinus albus]|nr:hypothetical protein Lal_00028325 [Lupinus albus]